MLVGILLFCVKVLVLLIWAGYVFAASGLLWVLTYNEPQAEPRWRWFAAVVVIVVAAGVGVLIWLFVSKKVAVAGLIAGLVGAVMVIIDISRSQTTERKKN